CARDYYYGSPWFAYW
nr:immunoglobulin heavy chain junction region [Mus musculus]